MLAAFSGKCNATVWRPSVRLSVRLSVPSAYSPWLIRGSIRCGQRTFRADYKEDGHTWYTLVIQVEQSFRCVCVSWQYLIYRYFARRLTLTLSGQAQRLMSYVNVHSRMMKNFFGCECKLCGCLSSFCVKLAGATSRASKLRWSNLVRTRGWM